MQDQNLLQEVLKKYRKEDYQRLSWDEYSEELETLTTKVVEYVRNHKLKVDAVVPLLRGGNIPATNIAYALEILNIIPVQYKYFFIDKKKCELRRIHAINKNLVYRDDPVLLLVEGNHCYGNQAKYAATDLKSAFPKCRIIYAASNMDYNYQDVVEEAEVSFYGNLTNACKELTDDQCEEIGIQYKKELIFPWEHMDEEWEIIELNQTQYNNLDHIKRNSTLVAEYDL